MTYTVETPRSKKRRLRWPKLPLAERQLAWTGRALLLLLPVLAFVLVEYLNYNSWDDFTPVQIALNLAWYYLLELVFYFVRRRRRAAAAKWAFGIAWGIGMANHYLISFRGRTLFPGDFLTLRTAANVAGNYDYRPDSMQWLTIGIFAAVLVLLSFLPREEKRLFDWRGFAPAAAGTAVFLAAFFGTGWVEGLGIEPSMWTTRGNGLVLNFTVCLKYMKVEKPDSYSQETLAALAGENPSDAADTAASADGGTRPVNVIVIMNEIGRAHV